MSSSSSSFASSGLSFQSSSSSEPIPEQDEEWDFTVRVNDNLPLTAVGSDDDLSMTDGEADLRFLVDGELEGESEDDLYSWASFTSYDEEEEEEEEEGEEEEEEDDSSSAGYPPAKRFRAWSEDDDDDDDEEEEAPAEGYGSSDEELAGSSADGSYDGDDEASDGP
jgi:hypothetical protein